MTKKKGNRYSISYRTLNDDKSCTLKLNSMLPLDESALEDFFTMGVECELSEIYKSLVGYYYENSTNTNSLPTMYKKNNLDKLSPKEQATYKSVMAMLNTVQASR